MRFYFVALLPFLAAAAPFPAQPNNPLSDGINKNLDAGNGEITAVQNLQSSETNKAPASIVNAGIKGVQSALDTAVTDRKANQALAGARRATPVQDGLAKVATAQGKAQDTISTLNGGAGDAATLTALTSTFEKGFATNENNLALVCSGNLNSCSLANIHLSLRLERSRQLNLWSSSERGRIKQLEMRLGWSYNSS